MALTGKSIKWSRQRVEDLIGIENSTGGRGTYRRDWFGMYIIEQWKKIMKLQERVAKAEERIRSSAK
jgi:hypothetical protein